MSQQPPQTRACPTCANSVPVMARYCPNCGTRLDPAAAYTSDDFEVALADVLDAPVEAPVDATPVEPPVSSVLPDAPTSALPPITAPTPSEQSAWTARASDWSEPAAQSGTWTAQSPAASPAKPGGNRTMWIILAILGFIVFCCCALFFTIFAFAANDTAFQNEISNLATLWIG